MKTVTVTVCSVATRNQVVVVRASLSVKARFLTSRQVQRTEMLL